MNKALRTEFCREVKNSRSRFLSILFIVALGVAFFTGVRSSEPDMHITADRYYDQQAFMDIRVLGTMGVTDADCEAIREVRGVADAEGMWSGAALTLCDGSEQVVTVNSLTERISLADLKDGWIPVRENECLMDFLHKDAYPLGSSVELYGGDSEDLTVREFTVVGYAYDPSYLTFERYTASIGSGSVFAYMYVPKQSLAVDYYTQILVKTAGTEELTAYTEEYEAAVQKVLERLEGIAEERSVIRLAEVKKEAEDTIREEEAKAKKTLADAKTALEDGEKQLKEGEQKYLDGRTEYFRGVHEYNEGIKQISENRSKVKNGLGEVQSGLAQLAAAEQELKPQEAALAEYQKQLDDAREQYEISRTVLTYVLSNLDALRGQRDDLRAELIKQGVIPDLDQEYRRLDAAVDEYVNTELAKAQADMEEGRKTLEAEEAKLAGYQNELAAGKAKINGTRSTLSGTQQELNAALRELDEAEAALPDALKTLEEAAETLRKSLFELIDGREELEEGRRAYAEGVKEMETELADARAEVDKLEQPEWYVLDRGSVQSYVEMDMDSARIGAVGKVFPVIFFLVAALVSLTTMTRMVDEQRTEIGTMKALGYRTGGIARKYLLYAFLATLLGSILGILTGAVVLPYVIQAAYGMMYVNLSHYALPIQWNHALLATGAALFCTVFATLSACLKSLKETPSSLMRPASPKMGKRILLERVGIIWKRLNFSWKASLRNLFRYKKRLFMTVFGIGGCMGLLMVGFGLQDSIAKIVDTQYQQIWVFNATAGVDSEADIEAVKKKWRSDKAVDSLMAASEVAWDVTGADRTDNVYLFVPETTEDLDSFVHVRDMDGHALELSADGVIISWKLADLQKLAVGDEIVFTDGLAKKISIPVTGIAENYLYHYAYITAEGYEKFFEREMKPNEILLELPDNSREVEDALAERMLADEDILSYSSGRSLQETVSNMMHAMDLVIWVIIIAAGLLAFVVLYNLNNININERRRELATIRVLGFYDMELGMYIYRENILLTVFGVIFGLGFGYYLHRFLIETLEVDMLMFGRVIQTRSYIFSILLTIFFSFVVNFVMYFRLRKINMIESLKSVE